MPTANEIRQQFIEYFESKQHRQVSSAPLVPKDDPTLLFTNAGMVQFKAPLLGLEKRDYNRAVTSQKCFRASGKHNDLENVGFTARHHTFFEMLGNFSFGNYFKEGAIEFCWDLLTNVYKLPQEQLWVSVHDSDDEAEKIWIEQIGVPADRVVRLGDKENFWAMGDTGPCGPCSEVHIDQGEAVPCPDPDNCGVECECDRILELWNLVFMQYERDESGNLTPLPAPSIDTGMGLERISAVMQGKLSNYETDLFTPFMAKIADLSGIGYGESDRTDTSHRVISDHIRAVAFLIGDGILPSNEGRGYVLRRVLRRAVRHGRVLGLKKPFLSSLVDVVAAEMGHHYPEVREGASYIKKFVDAEEKRFSETLDTGLKRLNEALGEMKAKGTSVLDGETAFKLYDTYGFPLDTITDVLRDEGLIMDEAGFEAAMGRQKAQSRAAWKGSGEKAAEGAVAELLAANLETEFVGYETRRSEAKIIALVKDGREVKSAVKGDSLDLIVDTTPFYANAGGQVGDIGIITGPNAAEGRITDTVKFDGRLWVHKLRVETGSFEKGDLIGLVVADSARSRTEANHTATHLLHEALRFALGDHVKQSGSSVGPDRFRFDFTHFEALTPDQLIAIEQRVNDNIRANVELCTTEMSMDEAARTGAIALFEEKYGEQVRVVEMPGISKELCGGTHVQSTGRIGFFKIASEESIAAGVRRIEALTGPAAVEYVQAAEAERSAVAALLKSSPGELAGRVEKLIADSKALEKELEATKAKLAQAASQDILSGIREVNGVKLLAQKVEAGDPKELRQMGDQIKDKLDSGVVILGAGAKKAFLLALVSEDLQGRFPAGQVVKTAAQAVGGGGGGRKDMAQAGGPDPSKLDQAFEAVAKLIEEG